MTHESHQSERQTAPQEFLKWPGFGRKMHNGPDECERRHKERRHPTDSDADRCIPFTPGVDGNHPHDTTKGGSSCHIRQIIRPAAMATATAKMSHFARGNFAASTVATANAAAACPEGNESQPLPPTGESSMLPACMNLGRGRPMACFKILALTAARPCAMRLCQPASFHNGCFNPYPTASSARLRMTRDSPFPRRSPISLS